jgi:hypothetical protein
MPTRSLASRISLALAAAAAALAAGSAGADLDPGREIVGTGDRVPGLGRIGLLTASPVDIDRAGHVLVVGSLSDGGRALVRTDGTRVETIWRHEEGGVDDGPDLASVVSSRDGAHIAALGAFQFNGHGLTHRQLFDLSDGTPRIVLSAGDRTTDGTAIAGFRSVSAVSDTGAILVQADIESTAGFPLNPPQAVILYDTAARVVASTDATAPAAIRFTYVNGVGVTDEGAAALSGCRAGEDTRCGIFRERAGALEPRLVEGDPGPDGSPIGETYALDTSADGEVLAYFYPPDNYDRRTIVRTAGDQVLPVRDGFAPLPDGRTLTVYGGRLNRRGDVILEGLAETPSSTSTLTTSKRVVLSDPAAGEARLLPEEAEAGRINDAGQIAVRVRPDGQPAQVIRWQNGTAQRVLSVHTTIGGGAAFIGGGLGTMCLGDDGRVAHLAQGTNGTSAWLCEDARGTHLVATTSNPPASYDRGAHCEFAGADQIVVLDGPHLSRLGRGGGTVLSVGDRLADGRAVTYIESVSADADATLLASVQAGGDRVLLRQERGGAVELVAIRLPGEAPPIEVTAAGIGADGTIAAFVYRNTGVPALVAVRDGATRVVTDFERSTIFSAMQVRGDYAVVSTATSTGTEVFRFNLSTGEGGPILQPDFTANPFVVDLTTSGDVLFQTGDVLDFGTPHTTWRWHAGTVEELSHVETPYEPSTDPVAVNAAGNVLTFAPGASAGGRYRLSLSGPAPSAACPGTAANSSSGDSKGCQVAPARSASWWPLVAVLFLAAARRRRGCAGTETRAPTGTS